MKKPGQEIATSSKIKFEDSEESDSASSDEEEEIKRALADVTFEDLQKARADGSSSLHRIFNEQQKSKRANKNRPMEVSCKKPVSRFREVIQAPKRVARDPRFEDPCGTLDNDGFRNRYSFLYEKELPAEREKLQKQLKKSNNPEEIGELTSQLSWIDKQLKSDSSKQKNAAILSEHKKREREAAKQGKKPFYLKKSEIRKQRHVEKFNSLKETGKLESFMEKRRRRNAAKDHRFIPYRRPNNPEQDSWWKYNSTG